ncbi:PREDICTED: threonine dehydratase biosynthetic, chloroplastic-like [Ipomoea nil]|uniref:threonine dehydratase biosynthetic, chloroplastic-like n=1 Tax=Ipomoea nil TaxID=35883 RepID=UPI0009019145|nr:PREDICTED: threonine dehydratase biosynthetic, chloroplastic-like [Ipomoea nil]
MDVLRFASTQAPLNLRCKPLSPAAANYTTVKAAGDVHVRRATSGALIRAALSRPEAQGLSSKSTAAAEKQLRRPDELPVVSPGSLTSEPGRVIPNLACHNGKESYSYRTMEYLTAILASNKVYDVALETPLQLASKITARLGNNIWLKREDLQPVFSFKIRGAYNMMAKLPREVLDRGVICSSSGNHAQGVALSAQKLGCNAVIVMPVTTPEIKWRSVERFGATVALVGDSFIEAQTYAKRRGEEEGRTFIPAFDHPDIIAGQGTVGKEIINQANFPIHAIFVPVGGGGLIAGIAAFVKMFNPQVKIIGVEPCDGNSLALALHHGERVMLDKVGSFAEGAAISVVGEESFRLCRELIDGVIFVSRDAMCASIKDMFEENRSFLEPAGALGLAGAEAYCKYYNLKDQNIVALTTGANMNFDRLRLVAELADMVGRQREAVLATILPEKPDNFKKFFELVGPMNITEFKYRQSCGQGQTPVLYSVGVHTKAELDAMVERMRVSGLHTIDLTDNELVKDHLRHLIGGRSSVEDELVCRFVLPERSAGALMKFLDAFTPRWNITLLHYRSQGEGGGGVNVLFDLQVGSNEMDEFMQEANNLGYEYAVETCNEAFQLFI